MNRIDIIQAFEDQKIFGALIRDQSTFTNWKVCLKAIFALSMDRKELRTYRKFTGRRRSPSQRFSEVFLAIGSPNIPNLRTFIEFISFLKETSIIQKIQQLSQSMT